MKYAVAVVFAAACISCSRQPPPADAAKAAQSAGPTAQNTVVLDTAARKQAGVTLEEARNRSLPQVLRSTARLANDENRTWRVGAITEGRIVQVLASPGDAVSAGQVLARMHSHGIHESRAEYRKAVSELARLKNVEAFSRQVRDRAKRLYEIKAGSLEQLEYAQTELKNAEAAAVNARFEVERTRNHLVEFLGIPADFTDHSAPGHDDNADYIPVRSPAAGTVLTRNVTPGTVVTPANDLYVISNLSRLWALAEVAEEHLMKLRPGMPVRIYVQAYGGHPFPGSVGKLGESLDPATRTVKVRVDVPNADGRLKPEMYATAEIELGASDTAVFVPEEATQEVRGQLVVFVRTAEDRFEVRPVQTGRTLDGAVEIVRGLTAGEVVAARGTFILKSEYLKGSLAGE
ncbi:MAG TPA: efflux RND transporter periplasmic adaptor subunit [Bryobacteraceae bacterium]|nr:efflux RND transporter periplasmic adaptor subunit [Bryobacteraceae bacterium]